MLCYSQSSSSLKIVVGDHHKGNTQSSEVTHSLRQVIMVGETTPIYYLLFSTPDRAVELT